MYHKARLLQIKYLAVLHIIHLNLDVRELSHKVTKTTHQDGNMELITSLFISSVHPHSTMIITQALPQLTRSTNTSHIQTKSLLVACKKRIIPKNNDTRCVERGSH